MNTIRFGTDGWRAIIADDFTFANVERVTQAAADYWDRNPVPNCRRLVLVGYDRRFLSDQFARRAAEVFAANQFEVILSDRPTPTPSVSFGVRAHRAMGGVVITASHNPPAFNGYKLKSHVGGPADSALCQNIEAFLDRNPIQRFLAGRTDRRGTGTRRTARIRMEDLRPAHFAAIRQQVDFKAIAQSRLRFAHDPLFGVGAGCFEELLAGTTCTVTTLNARHDPLFGGINPEPVARNYGPTSAYLRRHPHDLCLVTDGDADRVGAMDGRGRPLSAHQIICLLLQHVFRNHDARGRMIKALTTTSMVDKMCDAYGLPLVETGVGFKYICAEMVRGDVILGAEESGSIGFPGHVPERDGILAGLMLLEMLAVERRSIGMLWRGLERTFGPHRYAREDLSYPVELRPALMEYCRNHPPSRLLRSPVVEMKTYDGVKYVAADSSWLMLRGSGTEPVLRIYAETSTEEGAQQLLRVGRAMMKKVAR